MAGLVYLDCLPPVRAKVGYGGLGLHGDLGYENKKVVVGGRKRSNALSSHPPARILYSLRGQFSRFTCEAAVNDDAAGRATHANFHVMVDGHQAASAWGVRAGEPARCLTVDLNQARILELVVTTAEWEHSHAVWLEPRLEVAAEAGPADPFVDCLGRTAILPPASPLPHAARCIATIVSSGFEHLLDDLLGSLRANGRCEDAMLIILAVDCPGSARRVAEPYGATVVDCRRRSRLNPTVKSALYSLPSIVEAERFLCLDADTLVLGDLRPIFAAIDVCPPDTILAVRETNGRGLRNLEHAVWCVYWGRPSDIQWLLPAPDGEPGYPLVVNDGVFAGSRAALRSLDHTIRQWPRAIPWVDQRQDVWWRNQFIFNLALAHLRCGVELDGVYNVQMDTQNVSMYRDDGGIRARWRGRHPRILHFNGRGRYKNPEHRGRFAGGRDGRE